MLTAMLTTLMSKPYVVQNRQSDLLNRANTELCLAAEPCCARENWLGIWINSNAFLKPGNLIHGFGSRLHGNHEFSDNSPACATIEVWLEPKLLWELKINAITVSMNAGIRLAVTLGLDAQATKQTFTLQFMSLCHVLNQSFFVYGLCLE